MPFLAWPHHNCCNNCCHAELHAEACVCIRPTAQGKSGSALLICTSSPQVYGAVWNNHLKVRDLQGNEIIEPKMFVTYGVKHMKLWMLDKDPVSVPLRLVLAYHLHTSNVLVHATAPHLVAPILPPGWEACKTLRILASTTHAEDGG